MSATTESTANVFTSNLKEIAKQAKAAAAAAAAPPTEKYNRRQVNTEEHHARQLQMLNSFADHIVDLTNQVSVTAAQKGYGWTKVVEYYLPGFDKVENNGQIETVPRHAPELTHWAGRGANPSKDAVPIVMLLQGVRERTKNGYKLRPDLLAGGKTALQIAQEKLSSINLEYSFNVKNKSLIITAIWDAAEWEAFLERRNSRPRFPRDMKAGGERESVRERYSAPPARNYNA